MVGFMDVAVICNLYHFVRACANCFRSNLLIFRVRHCCPTCDRVTFLSPRDIRFSFLFRFGIFQISCFNYRITILAADCYLNETLWNTNRANFLRKVLDAAASEISPRFR